MSAHRVLRERRDENGQDGKAERPLHADCLAKLFPEKKSGSSEATVKNVLDEQERKGTTFDNPDEVLRSWAMEPIRKEVEELEMASESEEEYAEELADVIIMCLSVAGKLGIDIDAEVRRKMEINRERPWKHGKEPECNT